MIFIKVLIKNHTYHSIFSVTWKYQVEKGNKPNFINIVIVIVNLIILIFVFDVIWDIKISKNRLLDTLWIIKYFIKLQLLFLFLILNKGTKKIIIVSIINQIINKLFLDKIMSINIKNIVWDIFLM